MHNYIITLQYDGTDYSGWQIQKNTDNTIQGLLTKHISKYLNYDIHLIGSGRTDAGVHALRQTANFHCPNLIECHDFVTQLNLILPNDIRILTCSKTTYDFHSRYSAISKTYSYTICNDTCYDVFTRKYSYMVENKLDVRSMKEAAKLLIGTHDFTNFTNANNNKSKIRTIYSIDINAEIRNGIHHIVITYNGDGFLYNMIRILTGTLIDIGLGKLNTTNISNLLSNTSTRKRYLSGANIPPNGLCLKEVLYNNQ